MKPNNYQKFLFYSATMINWGVGLGLILNYKFFLGLFGPENVPVHPMYAHLFAALVLAFGLGYFRAATNPQRYRDIILLGGMAKILVFFIVVYYWSISLASGKLVILASADLLYGFLFFQVLWKLPPYPVAE